MSIRSLRAGRGLYDASTYTGTKGEVFYNEATGEFRRCDAVTPGGIPIPITLATSTTAGSVKPNGSFSLNPADGTLSLLIATEDRIGGVRLGPGVTTNESGQIIIDSSGLSFSFGDFSSIVGEYTDSTQYALLSSIKPNEDVVIASNGTGKISVVGEFSVHTTNGTVTGSLETDPVFKILADGQIQTYVTALDNNFGAIEIIGSTTGSVIAPGQPGTMLHLTGQSTQQCRFYMDGNGNYASIVGRRWNGTIDSRTQVLAGEDVLRINATAQTDASMPGVSLAQIAFTALENQTATAQGSEIGFTVTPVGSAATSRVKVLKVDGVGVTTDRLVKARNYEGAVRNAGSVGGTTVTLDWATDHMVHCVFTDNFTVAFANYTAGRTITLIATNTSNFDSDVITAGVSAVNTQGDNTLTVTEQTTAIITYYCVGTTVNDVYVSTVYA